MLYLRCCYVLATYRKQTKQNSALQATRLKKGTCTATWCLVVELHSNRQAKTPTVFVWYVRNVRSCFVEAWIRLKVQQLPPTQTFRFFCFWVCLFQLACFFVLFFWSQKTWSNPKVWAKKIQREFFISHCDLAIWIRQLNVLQSSPKSSFIMKPKI